jgi:hypothetical protein
VVLKRLLQFSTLLMISIKRTSASYKLDRNSATAVKITGINPSTIMENVLKSDMKQITKGSYSDDTATTKSSSTQFLSRSTSNRRYNDGDGSNQRFREARSTNASSISMSIDHKKLYVPDISQLKIRSLTGDLYTDIYKGKRIHCTWDRYEIDSGTIWPSPCKLKVISTEILEVYGMDHFCSLECCLAYHNEEICRLECKRNPVYKDCISNIFVIFSFINDSIPTAHRKLNLKPSNHWNLLEIYGNGNMSINEFRMSSTTYSRTDMIKMYPMCEIYELDSET